MKLIEKTKNYSDWFVKFALQILCALHKKINNLDMKKYGVINYLQTKQANLKIELK